MIDRLGASVLIDGKEYHTKPYFKNMLTIKNDNEMWLDHALKAALDTKPGAFVDVGANTGQTLIKMLELDSSRVYLGFEPQLDCCFYIEQFIIQNCLENHLLIPVGLSNHNGVMNLLKRDDNTDTTASIVEGFRPDEFYASRQAICVFKGDEVIAGIELTDIAIIKVDVEGGELEVIEGLEGTLAAHRPFIFFEVLNNYLAVTKQHIDNDTIEFRSTRYSKLEDMLRALDYSIFNILPDSKLMEITEIRPKVSADLRLTDYIAVPDNCKSAFIENLGTRLICNTEG